MSGFLDSLKELFSKKDDKAIYLSGFKKTKSSFGDRLRTMKDDFQGINDEFLEELTIVLLESDVGISTADLICEKLKEKSEQYPSLSFDWAMSFLLEVMKEIYKRYRELRHKKNRTHEENVLLQHLYILCSSTYGKFNII